MTESESQFKAKIYISRFTESEWDLHILVNSLSCFVTNPNDDTVEYLKWVSRISSHRFGSSITAVWLPPKASKFLKRHAHYTTRTNEIL